MTRSEWTTQEDGTRTRTMTDDEVRDVMRRSATFTRGTERGPSPSDPVRVRRPGWGAPFVTARGDVRPGDEIVG